mmetsp:Transcript_11729/g.47351  ORF Transcript_11729/g.47351 Transcript_11729/m.47351 type:complete len:207 (+) Transcript_11729:109-729(+)
MTPPQNPTTAGSMRRCTKTLPSPVRWTRVSSSKYSTSKKGGSGGVRFGLRRQKRKTRCNAKRIRVNATAGTGILISLKRPRNRLAKRTVAYAKVSRTRLLVGCALARIVTRSWSTARSGFLKVMTLVMTPLVASTTLPTSASPRLEAAENVASAAVVNTLRQPPCSGHAAPSRVPKSRVASSVALGSAATAARTASAARPSGSDTL